MRMLLEGGFRWSPGGYWNEKKRFVQGLFTQFAIALKVYGTRQYWTDLTTEFVE